MILLSLMVSSAVNGLYFYFVLADRAKIKPWLAILPRVFVHVVCQFVFSSNAFEIRR